MKFNYEWVDLETWLEWEKGKNSYNENKLKAFAAFYYQVLKKQYQNSYVADLDEITCFFKTHHLLANLFDKQLGYGEICLLNGKLIGMSLFRIDKGGFLKPALDLWQTGISDEAPANFIFSLIDRTKYLILKGISTYEVEFVMASLRPVAHNKRILKWFEQNFSKPELFSNFYLCAIGN